MFEQLYYNNDDSHGTKKILTEGDLQLYNLLLCGPEKRIKIRREDFIFLIEAFQRVSALFLSIHTL